MLKEFKEFAMRGNVLDLAIAVIIGAAFGTIITSLVNDILMPPIGLMLGRMDFKDLFIVLSGGTYASLDCGVRDFSGGQAGEPVQETGRCATGPRYQGVPVLFQRDPGASGALFSLHL